MKREILFRAKRTNFNEWVFGDLINYSENEIKIIDQNCRCWDILEGGYDVIPETVGQYTGKTTKNESLCYYDVKKLFEGDIFTIGDSKTTYLCVFENYEWIGISTDCDKYGQYNIRLASIKDQFYVIGNIHDNPELLNK